MPDVPLTAERQAALKVLLDAMPAAPWRVALSQPSPGIRTEAGWEVVYASYADTGPTVLEFIAAARNELPALFADHARLTAEVARLTALIAAPDGGGIPLPLLDELQAIAAESGCGHRDAIAVAAETAYSVGSEHAERDTALTQAILSQAWQQAREAQAEVQRRGEANTLLAQLNSEAHQKLAEARGVQSALRITLKEMLSTFNQKGHPGYAAVRSCWADEATVAMWHRTLELSAVPAAPVPAPADEPGSLLDDFPELADVRITFDPRRNTAPHTAQGPKASDPDREHPAHDGQTCEEYEAAPVVAEATQAECRRCGGSGEMTAPHGFVAICGRCGGTGKDPAAPDVVPAAADGGVA